MITCFRSTISHHWVSLLLCAGLSLAIPVRAADVAFYLIQKRTSYAQTGTGSPTLDGATPYRFQADVVPTGSATVNSASIRLPSAATQTLSSQPGSTELQFKQNFSTTSALNTAYPVGSYVYTLSTVHDGTKTLTLTMTTDNYPAAPHVSNFTTAQAVNPAAGFTLTWDAFSGGTANDLVSVEVDDNVTGQVLFQTPLPGTTGALDGTATSVLIPANTLAGSKTYQAKVEFDKVASFDTTSYPGAEGVVLFTARTTFGLVTAGGVVTGPDVSSFHVAKGELFTQTGTSAPTPQGATPYVFSASARLSSPNAATGGSVRLPNATTKVFTVQSDGLGLPDEAYASQTSLDAADPNGSYTVTLNTVHDGTKTITLSLAGNTYPAAPHLSNFSAAQAITASADFTLSWDAFAGGGATDFVSVHLEDPTSGTAFSSGDPGSPGALNGAATSVVIPANRLQAGHTYQATLTFVKVTAIDTTTYPGSLGVAGYFTETDFTVTTSGGVVTGPDVKRYGVVKGQQFAQSDANAPVLRTDAPFVLNSFVDASAPGSVASASVQLPNGTSLPLSASGDGSFEFVNGFTTQTALDTAFPSGTYHMNLVTAHDGSKNLPLTLAAANYPSTPHVSNFAAAQAINATADFTLTWDTFTGGTTSDFVQVSVHDGMGNTAFKTPQPGDSGALNGTAVSVVIPGNTLVPGATYFVTMTFARGAFDTTSYPGAIGIAAYFKSTDLTVTTSGGVVTGPDVQRYGVVKGQQFAQSDANAPVPRTDAPFLFRSFLDASAAGAVVSASLQLPNGTSQTLGSGGSFDLLNRIGFTTQTALDAAFPSGTYHMNLVTAHDGSKSLPLTLAAANYPSTPHVSNFAAAQAIDATADFTLTWDAFTGGTTSDFVQVSVRDGMGNTAFETPQPGDSGVLNGTAVSVVIPGNTLLPGTTYFVTMVFAHGAFDTTSYPGALGIAGYFKSTELTVATSGGVVTGPDVKRYGVVKGQQFAQSDANAPVPRTDAPFILNSFVDATAPGTVASASVQLPNGTSLPLSASGGDGSLEFVNGFTTQTALDTAFPSGTYHMSLVTAHDGSKSLPLTLGAANYPSTPHLSNFAAAQVIDATADFTLTWDAFTGGTTSDFVQVSVQDGMGNTAFKTPQPGEPGVLNGTAVSTVIPGNTLMPGATYFVTLLFARGAFDTTSYPGAIGIAAYFKSTDLTIAAKGGTPLPSPALTNPGRSPNGAVKFQLTGAANQTYQIQASADFTNWLTVTNVVTGPDGSADFIDDQASGFDHRFYRAVGGASTSARTSLSFNFYANFGSFGVNGTPQGAFPVPLNSYRALFGVNNDSALPAAIDVTFTGPAGSGLTNTPADFQNVEGGGSAAYESPDVQNPTAAPAGTWTVNYKGAPQTFPLQDPQANTRLVIAVPTITVVNGVLQQINWVYRSANGSLLSAPPSFMTTFQVQISGQNNVRLYDSQNLAPATTSLTLPTSPAINWSSVTSIAMTYEDDLGDSFVVFFYH
ncbi:MAG: hypothetical protein ACYDH9_01575 [Limisphaerales bacterium]